MFRSNSIFVPNLKKKNPPQAFPPGRLEGQPKNKMPPAGTEALKKYKVVHGLLVLNIRILWCHKSAHYLLVY